MTATLYVNDFESWNTSVPELLKTCDLIESTQGYEIILIKPNLVEAVAPPVTTPVELIREIVNYLQAECPEKKIIIAEGTGAKEYDTHYCFEQLGYTELASETGVELIDLNHEEITRKSNVRCSRWPEMHLPKRLDEVFLFSVPVLKAHSLAEVTLTMKNMMGCPPPSHYQQGGYWKKSSFHHDIHRAIFDLNCYRKPDYTLLDATVGMAESHLWGATCSPPVNLLIAGKDPVAMDAYGATLLGKNWQTIDYIKLANGILGSAEQYHLTTLENIF